MADFAYSPDFGYKAKPEFKVLKSEFENGADQVRLKRSKKRRNYELSFSNRTDTEYAAASAFFDSKKGSFTSFSINIDGVNVTGRFADGSFFFQRISPKVYNYGFNFEEVI